MRGPILLVDDERALLTSLRVLLAQHGHLEVDTLTEHRLALDQLQRRPYDLLLLDLSTPVPGVLELLRCARERHPNLQVVVLTADTEIAREALERGAHDYLRKPSSEVRILTTVRRALERAATQRELEALRSGLGHTALRSPEAFAQLPTQSPRMLATLVKVEQLAPSQGTVLLVGEPGTGKQATARALHALSSRAAHPFVAVDARVFAAALFASPQGRSHALQEAEGGTLFLDALDALSPEEQLELLQVLQEGEALPRGADTPPKADVRVIAASTRDLRAALRRGSFRRDLLQALSVNTLTLPPLRERKGDVPLLAQHFLHRAAQAQQKQLHSLTDAALEVLQRYPFPGNVDELERVIREAVAVERTDQLQVDSLPSALLQATRRATPSPELAPTYQVEVLRPLEEVEREHIARVLRTVGDNRTRAAQVLGLSRAGLYSKLKRYGL